MRFHHRTWLVLTDFLPMELDEIEALVKEKGIVKRLPQTPEGAIPRRS